ncbi:hypothetical protein ABW19_dt0202703 [Dactylella cylindrospora]|nr:hypothetical protein ABW19_dt0202703 [Dactylella cylindrospora]
MGTSHSREQRQQLQDQRRNQMSSPHSTASSHPYPYSPTPPIQTRISNLQPDLENTRPDITAIDTPTLTTALTYISNRLLQKTKAHHTFIVTGDVIFSLFFRCKNITRSVELMQTSMLTYKQKDYLISAVLRAGDKFGMLRDDWVNNAGEVALAKEYADEVVARSLAQKEIVFSGDGMSLIAVDFVYELRMMLHRFSKELEEDYGDEEGAGEGKTVDMDNMVELVRRLVAVEGKGRSLKRAWVEERYDKLEFSDYAWMILGEEYERRFGEKGLKADGEEDDDEDEEEGIIMAGARDRESVWTDAS